MTVRSKLPVLLVDGNPAGSFFDRAAGYAALALAPGAGVIAGKHAGERFLMDPRVVSASTLRESDLDDAAVVVLADVPRLPAAIASRLAAMIAGGNGLLVIAGPRAESGFYNSWQGIDGPLLPLPLDGESVDSAGISPAASTFVHEALGIFGGKSDLGSAAVKRWRRTGDPNSGGILAAAFSNGDAFLATRGYGNGRCVLATCAFDSRAGNLPAKRAFVPLIHELVSWAAGGGVDLNVDSAWNPAVILNSSGGGLSARYFRDQKRRKDPAIERVDPAIDFDWKNNSPGKRVPNDRFIVEWNGNLVPPVSGSYLIEAEADDSVDIRIGSSFRIRGNRYDNKPARITLEAGSALPVSAIYQEDGGEAWVRLWWTPPGGVRQIIPSSAFMPAAADQTPLEVLDPRGLPREATLLTGRRGRELSISGSALPGIYQVSAGNALDESIPGIRDGKLPVAVTRDAAESHFEAMTADDLALIRTRVDLLQPKSVEDMLGILRGKGFGREIWKLLAVAGFILFLLESVLARWVSKSRRTAEDVRVDFGESTIWRGGR